MIRRFFPTALLPCLLYLAGCSFVPLRYMPIDSDILKNDNGPPLLDPNSGPLKGPTMDLEEPCRIKYNPFCYIMVTGQLNQNYQCRVMIDTGCPFSCMLSYNVVQENNLPIYPIKGLSPSGGICFLPYLQIGRATIREVPCLYMIRQWELQFFGIPINKIRVVFFGLQLIKEFRYILFDGVHGELELSSKQSFMPMQNSQWLQYPFKIEDINKNLRLMVDIPIEGKNYHIGLDTGADAGLIVDTKFFDMFSKSIKVTAKKQNFKHANYQAGWVDCQKIVLSELDFCHRKIKNAQIVILPDDMTNKYTNFVGMQYFKDTVFVLDFENELLWVKDKEIVKK